MLAGSVVAVIHSGRVGGCLRIRSLKRGRDSSPVQTTVSRAFVFTTVFAIRGVDIGRDSVEDTGTVRVRAHDEEVVCFRPVATRDVLDAACARGFFHGCQPCEAGGPFRRDRRGVGPLRLRIPSRGIVVEFSVQILTEVTQATLDRTRAKYANMVLVHGGGPGVEKIAASWAEARGVDQIVCRPDWNAHGKAAPFRRNDDLLNLLPKGVIAFPGSGITGNMIDKAKRLGIPVMIMTV